LLSFENLFPIEGLKQDVLTHFGQSLFGILFQTALDKLPGQRGETLVDLYIGIFDIVDHRAEVFCLKGMITMEHFKEDNANSINVTTIIDTISISKESLGCKVKRCTKKAMCVLIFLFKLFGQTKISQINMAVLSQENVLRL
jgi:hypothetical protein